MLAASGLGQEKPSQEVRGVGHTRDTHPARAPGHSFSLVAHGSNGEVVFFWGGEGLVCLRQGLIYSLGWPGTHCIDQAGLELEILSSVGITGMHRHIWLKRGDFT